jgi:dihydrofolate synthase/folylpolyglutamate synthase
MAAARKTDAARMSAPTPLTRAAALAWLERRVNYERTAPPSPTAGSFGLARMRRLLKSLGSPHLRCRVVHVAGTKGKGSVVAMLAQVLHEAGHRVGRYMSPHVHAIEERIAVGGRPISSADMVRAFAEVIPVVDRMDRAAERRGRRGPTWFEVMTAVALVHFARARVDIAVLETGLGGRLDATNVCRPVLSIITSISLDHMRLLGATIAKIAAEKAGIIKRGRLVISGATAVAARRVIAATAARRRAPLLQLGVDFHCMTDVDAAHPLTGCRVRVITSAADDEGPSFRLGMPGRHQADNAALVIVAARRLASLGCDIPERALRRGLARARLPARIEIVGRQPLLIVDAAHNVASITALAETLGPVLEQSRRHGGRRVLVFAASVDKQIEAMLAAIGGRFDHVVLTRYLTNPRAASIDRLVAAAEHAGLRQARRAPTPAAAVAMATSLAGPEGIVCVAGSFFLAGETTR